TLTGGLPFDGGFLSRKLMPRLSLAIAFHGSTAGLPLTGLTGATLLPGLGLSESSTKPIPERLPLLPLALAEAAGLLPALATIELLAPALLNAPGAGPGSIARDTEPLDPPGLVEGSPPGGV